MDLAHLFAPHSAELADVGRALHAERSDLKTAFPDPDSIGFRQWLGVNGVLEDERVASLYPALPPETLRATACGGPTLQSHLYSGAEDFKIVAELFQLYGDEPFDRIRGVLDFGCGCGRLLRWFQSAMPETRLFGADVRHATIDWCKANLEGTYLANDIHPPLELEDNSVDLSVALSVFSHLSLEQNLAWMRELARVTRPGGKIIVSTHGAFALVMCSRSPEHQAALQIDSADARAMLRELPKQHFLHTVLPSATLARADGVSEDYGQAFFDEAFVEEHWSSFVDVLGCVPVALNLFQDIHVLRAR